MATSPTAPPAAGTALPTPPSTSDPSNFDTRGDAFFAALPVFQSEEELIKDNVYTNAAGVYTNAVEVAANTAAVSANTALAASYAGAIPWVSGTTYAIGDRRTSLTNGLIYIRTTSGAGTTDPSADAANWQIVQVTPPVIIVSSTSQTAVAGYEYVLTNVALTTVTLPASPAVGDKVIVKPCNGLATNVINPNGETIEDVAGNMTIDNAFAVVNLQYLNSSWRLV